MSKNKVETISMEDILKSARAAEDEKMAKKEEIFRKEEKELRTAEAERKALKSSKGR